MLLRRYISTFVLLAVYVFAVGTPAVLSLLCECSAEHRQLHACCLSHCAEESSQTELLKDDGCNCDRHALSTQLYAVATQTDNDRIVRSVVVSLPSHIGVEILRAEVLTSSRFHFRQYPLSLIAEGTTSHQGLRAPPVAA